MGKIKAVGKKVVGATSVGRKLILGKYLYKQYCRQENISMKEYIKSNYKSLKLLPIKANKSKQLAELIRNVEIVPVNNNTFFYSIDCFKSIELKKHIFDNYSTDYNYIIKGSLFQKRDELLLKKSEFSKNEVLIIDALYEYYKRCYSIPDIKSKYEIQLDAIGSLFERPAATFFEGLQRILFFNQFLWQSKHKNNGFGHLDWMLIELYRSDIANGRLTTEQAALMIKDFFRVLHEYYWFKSSVLLGDTGQIIILGGLSDMGVYNCNELTYKFIEASMELKLPDPKVLLRCSTLMPKDLLEIGLKCIATGIGAPLLSNDDAVVPALISFGYDKKDAYNYVTSACWEPLMLNNSCEQNNIASINFVQPFTDMFNNENVDEFESFEDIIYCYKGYLQNYLSNMLLKISKLQFEEEPLFSLLSDSSIERQKDIVRGGAKYCNLGLTSVGMSTVVNSLVNIDDLVFKKHEYSISQLNAARKNNFDGAEDLIVKLKKHSLYYGCNSSYIINLVKKIECFAEEELERHKTKLDGNFKFGLSSPNYIMNAKNTEATFDGRKNGESFTVHISADASLPVTELLAFAMQLDYGNRKINGNVVDFMVTPSFLKDNMNKYVSLLLSAFKGGVYQVQINVLDSATLIEAKANPDKFTNLIVRVWGFSAYFNDLPDEYKDVLIKRAIENEKEA